MGDQNLTQASDICRSLMQLLKNENGASRFNPLEVLALDTTNDILDGEEWDDADSDDAVNGSFDDFLDLEWWSDEDCSSDSEESCIEEEEDDSDDDEDELEEWEYEFNKTGDFSHMPQVIRESYGMLSRTRIDNRFISVSLEISRLLREKEMQRRAAAATADDSSSHVRDNRNEVEQQAEQKVANTDGRSQETTEKDLEKERKVAEADKRRADNALYKQRSKTF